VCKIWTKNSQPFGKKCQKTSGGIFLTHTVDSFDTNVDDTTMLLYVTYEHCCQARNTVLFTC